MVGREAPKGRIDNRAVQRGALPPCSLQRNFQVTYTAQPDLAGWGPQLFRSEEFVTRLPIKCLWRLADVQDGESSTTFSPLENTGSKVISQRATTVASI